MRGLLQVLALVSSVLAAALPSTPSRSPEPLVAGKAIKDSYIVVFKDSVSDSKAATHRQWAKKKFEERRSSSLKGIKREFKLRGFKGYAGSFDAETIDAIKKSDEVAYVEEDRQVQGGICSTPRPGLIEQNGFTNWGLGRISQSCQPDLTRYFYDQTAGQGTTAYVLDTGVRVTHEEFEGRASYGVNFTPYPQEDVYGHGTHVSGIIAGKINGVAKKANIISVKVLGDNNFGSWSDVISGVEWSVNDATSKGTKAKSVINLSIWGGTTQSVNDCVRLAREAGVNVVTIAGNSGSGDVSSYSPGSEPSVITVAASTSTDNRAGFSTYGSLVDLYAPGDSIYSAFPTSDSGYAWWGGTSMAAPHVAGVVLYLIASENLSTPAAVENRLIDQLASHVIQDPGAGTTARLLYNGAA